MRPSFALHNGAGSCGRDAKLPCEVGERFTTFCPLANSLYGIFVQFGVGVSATAAQAFRVCARNMLVATAHLFRALACPVLIANSGPVLGQHVLRVVAVTTKKQVRWVDAPWIITLVAYTHVIWNRFVSEFIRHPASVDRSASVPKLTISVCANCSKFPTLVRTTLINLAPKALADILDLRFVGTRYRAIPGLFNLPHRTSYWLSAMFARFRDVRGCYLGAGRFDIAAATAVLLNFARAIPASLATVFTDTWNLGGVLSWHSYLHPSRLIDVHYTTKGTLTQCAKYF